MFRENTMVRYYIFMQSKPQVFFYFKTKKETDKIIQYKKIIQFKELYRNLRVVDVVFNSL
jgi:hypothetical protein